MRSSNLKEKLILFIVSLLLVVSAENTLAASKVIELHKIATAPSADRIKKDIEKLVSFGTRHTLSETKSESRGIGAARRWIKKEFESISKECGGCLEVYFQSEVISGQKRIPDPVEVVSVIAVQKGGSDRNRYLLMSGDIDSRVSNPLDATSDSPGANDNASGLAGVLETARILSRHKFSGSIVYAALAGEEQGLFGGQILAKQAIKDGWFVEAVLNNDMIGNIEGINGVIDNTTARVFSEGIRATETPEQAKIRRFTGGEVDSPSRNLARYIDRMADTYMPDLDVMMIYRLDRFGRGGHHRPFNDVGYPGVRIMETNENYDRQHQDIRSENGIDYGDVIEGVNFGYAAKLTALNAVSLASMAWAPAPPKNLKIKGAVQPHTSLSWEKVKGATSYKVYWRLTTSPQWTWSKDVGNKTEYKLENIVIDNYIFGVASMSRDGMESPVVFPGPIGNFYNH